MSNPSGDMRYHRELGTLPRQSNLAILQDDNFKLVHFNGGVKPLLYDLHNDPNETTNIAGNSAFGGELLAMTQKMLDHKNDPCPSRFIHLCCSPMQG